MPDQVTPVVPVVNATVNMQERLAAIHAKAAAAEGAPPPVAPVPDNVPAPTPTFVGSEELSLPVEAPVVENVVPEPEVEPESEGVIGEIQAAAAGKKKGKDLYENFKKLRTKSEHQAEELSTKDNLLAELTRKVEQYESGEVVPEPLQQLQERVRELEPYERLHALRLSPEYEEKYAAPLEESIGKARQFAQDYAIDPNVLDHARGIENKRERNKFLRGHLDEVGALEVVSILDEITEKEAEVASAEAEPAVTFEQLKAERANQTREMEQTRVSRIKTNATEGWKDALKELRSSGEYPEVTLTGDQAIDSRIMPIIESASREYGKFVTSLGGLKAQDLPKEEAKTLAKWALMAHSASLMATSRAAHYKSSKEIIEANKRQNPMFRPQIGQSSGMGRTPNGADGTAPKITSQNAAEALRNRLLSNQ